MPFVKREGVRDFFIDNMMRESYNYTVFDYGVFISERSEVMANRDHALDGRITDAACSEFLEKGYQGASLRKIAERAGVTVGAIQIRYKTKDALFCSLLEPFLAEIEGLFQATRAEYWQYPAQERLTYMEKSMRAESEAILNLIFDHYQEATLLLCRSDGSSLAGCFDRIVERKVSESTAFFEALDACTFDQSLLRLLIAAQFHSYRQIVRDGYERDRAKGCMRTLMRYHLGGWTALLSPAGGKEK